jgi:ElaA protein
VSRVTLAWYEWPAFDPDTLYALLRLRSEVFVVEQACVFAEMDGIDPACTHLLARDAQGQVAGCLRLVPPHLARPHSPSPPAEGPALGRLVTRQDQRGSGLGRRLMIEGLRECARRHPQLDQYLSAQQHLEGFYASLGFQRLRPPYDEDGIAHVDMRRAADRSG